ncbi:CehA/McbA family metallohydrolase [Mesorhizobium sp. Cs1321R2N1]|uniref:CehA/McbA family metallohydrolase n=1 Tax=Mesorhizobium sp. Cs1321R2N1 TaxID=3015174 RepID=UPI00301B92DA
MHRDGPASPLFRPVSFEGNFTFEELARDQHASAELAQAIPFAHSGSCVAWGIPFEVGRPVFLRDQPLTVEISPTTARWFVFLHASGVRPLSPDQNGLISPMRGIGQLGEHAADYILIYDDGSEQRAEIRRRNQIGSLVFRWAEHCTQAVAARKPRPLALSTADQPRPISDAALYRPIEWGRRQTQALFEEGPWMNFVWALENANPKKAVAAIRFEPVSGIVIVSGVSAGDACSMPLRWEKRKKVLLRMPPEVSFDPTLDEHGLFSQVQLDLGQVITATPRLIYPTQHWEKTRQNLQPEASPTDIVVEYSAHADACFHLFGDRTISVTDLDNDMRQGEPVLQSIQPANQCVMLRVVEQGTNKPAPVKLHVHGSSGEYLAPLGRNRNPSRRWFENYGPEYWHGQHLSTYISGQTPIELPLGDVYLEITKGFEVKPIRRKLTITRETELITVELEKVLHWREEGWVTADTHVHFLAPATAMLEGAAEGVNVINLLASQWGELMTNIGDFDGRTTLGSKAAGGDGEFLVRVGTENRQRVLGHISLLGYSGNMIVPLAAGGPDESAIGDALSALTTEWAQQCKKQGGLVVLPHFPDPRMESAATIVLEEADAVEMTSFTELYRGIDPYSLSDWYRYLNNGYHIPAVAGTDKMSAECAVGMIRTYAKIPDYREFSYETWMDAVRSGHTFVTYGPLMDLNVEGKPMGSRIAIGSSGGAVNISWNVSSVIMPMTTIDLVVNGEVRESRTLKPWQDAGSWSVRVQKSSWMAVLVRAKYDDKPEMIAAHSSAVMIDVEGSQLFAAADALTILEQIEGSLAFVDTIGIRAETKRYKEMRLVLQSAYQRLHNKMHEMGYDHPHHIGSHHPEHEQMYPIDKT